MEVKRRISAVLSMPRLCFTDNIFCAYHTFRQRGINVYRMSDIYWEQTVSRLLKDRVDAGDDYVIVVDYDSLFDVEQLDQLLELIEKENFDAVFPVQIKRNSNQLLVTQLPSQPIDLNKPFSPALTGHFGLTVIRCSALAKLPQPWFWSLPNTEGLWEEGEGRVDADNWFWVEMNRHGFKCAQANHVRIGHMDLMATWPTPEGLLRKYTYEFSKHGVPPEAKALPPELDQAGAVRGEVSTTPEPSGDIREEACASK